ncbi:DMT family transporter [Pacificimonas sp. WHA3]|uniref:DMT family transporter n=1 Tax=Pacificimonas pallii TaxID=2827236 RepID=A0ABS6SGX8_9SPHN|nr:DMT family transporter [Pacificimonas pallii]MBV7257664.1 DMT family transporter [Pacificimonas pallii]
MPVRVLLPLAIVTLIWGTTWYVIKTQLGVVPAPWSVAYRFTLAALLMFVLCFARGRSIAFPAKAHFFFLMIGVFQFAGNFNLVYQASRFVTSGLIAVAFALLVVPNAILARIFLGHRVDRQFMIGSALGIMGVALLFRQELLALADAPDLALGIGATVLGILCASAANVMQAAPQARAYGMSAMLAWAMTYGSVINIIFAWRTSGPPVIDAAPLYLGGIAYLAVFASAIAFVLYFGVIREIGPAKAAYSSVLIPFVAMTISTVLEGYQWTPYAIGGAVLTALGLVIALRAKKRVVTAPPAAAPAIKSG